MRVGEQAAWTTAELREAESRRLRGEAAALQLRLREREAELAEAVEAAHVAQAAAASAAASHDEVRALEGMRHGSGRRRQLVLGFCRGLEVLGRTH